MQIQAFSKVSADYTLTEDGGQLIAASPPGRPLRYVHGSGQMLPALEHALLGKRVGERVTVTLAPEQAYGPYRPELVFEAVRENLPQGQAIRIGMTLTPGGQRGKFSLKVVELTERGAMLDGNHPLAGKTVTWQLEILSVQPDSTTDHGNIDHQPIRWVELDD